MMANEASGETPKSRSSPPEVPREREVELWSQMSTGAHQSASQEPSSARQPPTRELSAREPTAREPSAYMRSMERSAESVPSPRSSTNVESSNVEEEDSLTPTSKEKALTFRYEKMEHMYEMEKAKVQGFEEERKLMKKQLDDGMKRRDQMKKIEKMMPEFRRQIDEARIENEELTHENDELSAEIERLKLLGVRDSEEADQDAEAREKAERLNAEVADSRVSLDAERRKAQIERHNFQQEIHRLLAKGAQSDAEIERLRKLVESLTSDLTKAHEKIHKMKESMELMRAQLDVPQMSTSMPGSTIVRTNDKVKASPRQQ